MNIFFLDTDIETCINYYCFTHVIKLILEWTQLLYNCHHCLGEEGWRENAPRKIGENEGPGGYRKTHENHPMTKWVKESLENYLWLLEAVELLSERFKKKKKGKAHACHIHIKWLRENIPKQLESKGLTVPPLCVPDEYKGKENYDWNYVINCYREYYARDKLRLFREDENLPPWVSLYTRAENGPSAFTPIPNAPSIKRHRSVRLNKKKPPLMSNIKVKNPIVTDPIPHVFQTSRKRKTTMTHCTTSRFFNEEKEFSNACKTLKRIGKKLEKKANKNE